MDSIESNSKADAPHVNNASEDAYRYNQFDAQQIHQERPHPQLQNDMQQSPATVSATAASLTSFTILHPALASASPPPLTAPSVYALASTSVHCSQPKVVLPSEQTTFSETTQTPLPIAFKTMVVGSSPVATPTSSTPSLSSSPKFDMLSAAGDSEAAQQRPVKCNPDDSGHQHRPQTIDGEKSMESRDFGIKSNNDHQSLQHENTTNMTIQSCDEHSKTADDSQPLPSVPQTATSTTTSANTAATTTTTTTATAAAVATAVSMPNYVPRPVTLERRESERDAISTPISMPTVSTASSDEEICDTLLSDDIHPYFASAFDIRSRSSPNNSSGWSANTSGSALPLSGSGHERHPTQKENRSMSAHGSTEVWDKNSQSPADTIMTKTRNTHITGESEVVEATTESLKRPESRAISAEKPASLIELMQQEQRDAQRAIDADNAAGNIASKATTFGFTPVKENGQYDNLSVKTETSAFIATEDVDKEASGVANEGEDNLSADDSHVSSCPDDSQVAEGDIDTLRLDSQHPQQQQRVTNPSTNGSSIRHPCSLTDPSFVAITNPEEGPRVKAHDISVVSHIRAGISPALTLDPHTTANSKKGSVPLGSQPNIGASQDSENEPQMEALVAQKDWSQTPLGPRSSWPPELQMMLLLIMRSASPLAIYWGEECILIYNDVWRPILKQKHPLSLGAPGPTVWSEIWDVLGAQITEVQRTGRGSDNKGLRLDLHREGYQEECYFDFTFSPIFVQDGSVGGILAFVQEVTKSILSQRRLKTLNQFSKQATLIQSEAGAYSMITKILQESNNPDVTFSILYRTEEASSKFHNIPSQHGSAPPSPHIPSGYHSPHTKALDPSINTYSPGSATVRSSPVSTSCKKEKDSRRAPQTAILCATSFDRNLQTVDSGGEKERIFVKGVSTRHIPDSLLITPEEYEPLDPSRPIHDDPWAWPVHSVLADGVPRLVTLPKSSHKLARALILPILENPSVLESRITTVLIVGINPYQMLDNEYLDFLALLVGNIGSLLHFGRVRENERMNAEALYELNQAKISFFQNVSHELRTPLTLMLAPLEDVIAQTPSNSALRPNLEMIQRNTRRLLKLVNTLLQFSRIEAGRSHAMFEETDLAKYTRDISANFESVARGFHLDFKVDCQPLDSLPGGVWVDQAMWSGILLNLLGNAFKHTWKGGVTVRQYPCTGPGGKPGVALEVADTGVGIAAEHLPTLFGRFNRIENKQSRSHEGTGIGLSLVKELTEIHGGTVVVTSKVDVGSTFSLWIPAGRDHHPCSQVKLDESTDFEMGQPQILDNRTDPSMFTEEATQWISHKTLSGSRLSPSGTDSTEEEKSGDYDDTLLFGIDPLGKRSDLELDSDYEVTTMNMDEAEFSKILSEPSSELYVSQMPLLISTLISIDKPPSTHRMLNGNNIYLGVSYLQQEHFPVIGYLPPSKSPYNDNNDEGERSSRTRKTVPHYRSLLPKAKTRRGFIIVVDDNNDMRAYLREILGKEFRVRCAVDGIDALRLIKERHKEGKRIDLVLSDVAMPNMNGYELLAKLRSDPQTMTTPFILLSARAGEEANVEGLDRGADDCMVKPFSARELLARVRSSIRLSDVRRELFREQRHALELKQLIYSISVRIRSGLSLPQILDTASRELFKVIRCNAIRICRFRSVDPATKQHWVRFVSEIVHKGKPKVMSQAEHLLPQGLQVSDEGTSDVLLDQDTELKQVNNYQHPVYGAKSFISVALFYNRKIWGYLLASRDGDMEDWSQSEKLLFEQTATQISLAIAHASLWEQKKQQQVEMEAAHAASEAKSQILANTSHELRTPIGAIVGALSALEDTDYNLTGEQRDMIKIMQITSDVALSVINDLLDTAKLESGTMMLCIKDCPMLLDTLEQSVRIFADKAGRKEVDLIMEPFMDQHALEPSIRSGQQVIWTDGDRLQQVIMNLIGNAVKFTSVGKVVVQCSLELTEDPNIPSQKSLTTHATGSESENRDSRGSGKDKRKHHHQHFSSFTTTTNTSSSSATESSLETTSMHFPQQAKYLSHRSVPIPPDSQVTHALIRFEVRDTGIGIDPEFLKNQIFQSFAQVDQTMTRRFGGTGLGLAISKHLVMMNGGVLGVTSEVGQGSTFYFTWPIVLIRNKDANRASAAVTVPMQSLSTCSLTSRVIPSALSAETAASMRAVVIEPVEEARNFLAWILHQQGVVTCEYDNVDQMLQQERQRTTALCNADETAIATNYRPYSHFFFSTKTDTADSIFYASKQLVEMFKELNAARRRRCEINEKQQQSLDLTTEGATASSTSARTTQQALVLSIVLVIFSSPQGRALAKEMIRKIKRLAPSSELTIRCRYILKPVKLDRVLECFHISGVSMQYPGPVMPKTGSEQQHSQRGDGDGGNRGKDDQATMVAPSQADMDNLRTPYPHVRQQHNGAMTRAEFMDSGEYDKDSTCNRNTPELARTPSTSYIYDDGDVFWSRRIQPSQPPRPSQQQQQQQQQQQHHSHYQSHQSRHQHHHHHGHSGSRRAQFPESGQNPPIRGDTKSRALGNDSNTPNTDESSSPDINSASTSKLDSRPPSPQKKVGHKDGVSGPGTATSGRPIHRANFSSDSTSATHQRRRIWGRKTKASSAATTSTEDSSPASPPPSTTTIKDTTTPSSTVSASISEVAKTSSPLTSGTSPDASATVSSTAKTPSVAAFSSRAARAAAGKRERRGKTVLCVEDNIINLRVVQYQLEKLGFDTKSAPDGQVAVDMIKEQVVLLGQNYVSTEQDMAGETAPHEEEILSRALLDQMQQQPPSDTSQQTIPGEITNQTSVANDTAVSTVTTMTTAPIMTAQNGHYTPLSTALNVPHQLVAASAFISSSPKLTARPAAMSSAVLDSLVDTIPAVSYQRHGEDLAMSSDAGTDTEENSEANATCEAVVMPGTNEVAATVKSKLPSIKGKGGENNGHVRVSTLTVAEMTTLDHSQAEQHGGVPAVQSKQVEKGHSENGALSLSLPLLTSLEEQDPLPSIMSSALSLAPNEPSNVSVDPAIVSHPTDRPPVDGVQPRTNADSSAVLTPTPQSLVQTNSREARSGSETGHHEHQHQHHHKKGNSSRPQKIDLILMDCAMPVKSGFEAATEIRQMGQYSSYAATVPIIALTASAVPSTKEKCLAAGMNGYLSKPTKLKDLEGMLNQWLQN
ncbi:hypothetical protein BGW42_002108 [Actinomortierella wolfii]|nr:hypothetical protein BGW42_002108 [Actinomortierella wolfii]